MCYFEGAFLYDFRISFNNVQSLAIRIFDKFQRSIMKSKVAASTMMGPELVL